MTDYKQLVNSALLSHLPRVLLASAEFAPLAKTGGLANAVWALSKELIACNMELRIITPYHRVTKERFGKNVEHLFHFYIDLGWRHEYVGIETIHLQGLIVYLIDNEHYFGGKLYAGGDLEAEQYAFFSRAILEAIPKLDFKPDIIHCNDWHTAMLPMLAKTQYGGRLQTNCHYLLTIHNLAFQGNYRIELFKDLFGIPDCYFTPDKLEFNGQASFLKAGCLYADKINTVSPSYALEIRTPEYGEKLDGVLNVRAGDLCGILNGIDTELYNPGEDPLIPANFDALHPYGKMVCKQRLQERMGLEIRKDVPLFAMVTRLTEQKGFELVQCMLDEFMQSEDAQFVLLGEGEERFENYMRSAEGRYRGRVCAYIGYHDEAAHLIYAGSDFFLMPSKFEPCGTGQMIAMRYGCIPIVRETGGLKDTVIPYNRFRDRGNGFSFIHFDAWEMRDAIRLALSCFHEEKIMRAIIQNAMKSNFSAVRSATEYLHLYQSMI